MKEYLIQLDVPGIKKYVFGTDRLVEIRGASALLAALNEKETPAFLSNRLGPQNVDCIFSGGGAGQFLVRGHRQAIEAELKGLQKLFHTRSERGLHLLYGMAEFQKEHYQASLEGAFLDLRKKKEEEAVTPFSPLHSGFIRECDSCSEMAARIVDYVDKKLLLCSICAQKVESGRGRGLNGEFLDFLKEKEGISFPAETMPNDFETIGENSRSKKGYTALIYADGNAMGRLIKSIEDKEQFRFFSGAIESAVKEACHEAIHAVCPPVAGEKIPASILLLGGDDLMVYMAAEGAMPFAIEAAKRFEQKTRKTFAGNDFFAEKLQGRGMTLSFGIAYGRSHTPFSILFSQAEELLKSAKSAGSAEGSEQKSDFYSPTYIDFHQTAHFNQVRVSDSRKNHLQLEGPRPVQLYQKPYSLADAEKLLHHAGAMAESKIPRSRRKRFAHAPYMGKLNGTLECLKLYTRIRSDSQRMTFWKALEDFDCIREMPWKPAADVNSPVTTMLTDIMELAEYSPRSDRKQEIKR